MDQEVLVNEAQALTKALDATKIAPRAVMITLSSETGNWKIWIVPRTDEINKQEFYRIVAEAISRIQLKTVDVASVELRDSKNQAIKGMSRILRMPGIGAAYFSNNSFNGILLPDGIVVRMEV